MALLEATRIVLTVNERDYLYKISRSRNYSAGIVLRAKILLSAELKKGNNKIAKELGTSNKTVRLWRNRWANSKDQLLKITKADDFKKSLEKKIVEILSDAERPGCPKRITPEQKAQILSLACEKPEDSGLPLSHWTIKELVKEIKKRKIVEEISWTRVQTFLKYGGYQTA